MESKNVTDPEQLAAHTLRLLAVDAVEKAQSGHPGLPMGMADCALVLFQRFLRFDPLRPDWPGRDRFVLSAGHGSMLLYGLLHLYGYDLTLEDLQRFRQWASKTPGHPERGVTPGVEISTGPLGQGAASSVGLALASRFLGARVNTEEFQPGDYRVFALVSDGDLMEGVSAEAASLAGHLALGNLIWIYDDNRISIEGDTGLSFTEDVGLRFEAYGWQVQQVDGHDRGAVARCLAAAVDEKGRPSLICASTHIGFGSPHRQDSAEAHGSPLGAQEVEATKAALGFPLSPSFLVPKPVRDFCRGRTRELTALRKRWEQDFHQWESRHPDRAALWRRLLGPELPAGLTEALFEIAAIGKPEATRVSSGRVLQRAAEILPGLLGGSADLAPSVKSWIKDSPALSVDSPAGRNLHFGVREHAMGGILNGLALSGAAIPFGGTFLVFADYLRPAMRLAALMKLGVIYVFTHDSLFVGEDGPTHQPVEHLAALRCIPDLVVYRPADALETAAGWAVALTRRQGPTALILSRQNLPQLDRPTQARSSDLLRGAQILVPEKKGQKAVVVASGSEVACAVAAARALGIRAVSMPSIELFLSQPAAFQRRILPPGYRVAVVEASRDSGWYRLVGPGGLIIGMPGFGASAPADELARRFGLDGPSIQRKLARWVRASR